MFRISQIWKPFCSLNRQTKVSAIKPGFQSWLLNQGLSHFAHLFFKPSFQLLNPGFKLKSGIKFMNPVFQVEN